MTKILEILNSLDTRFSLTINSLHNNFLDFIMYWSSEKIVWLPLYIYLFYLVIKTYKRKTFLIVIFIAILITMSDQIASGIIKELVKRLRPCHDIKISHRVHIVYNYCGGQYGFVSSHAANSFALVIFLIKLLKQNYKWITAALLTWVSLISYSRIYLGVHYFGDILCGALLGICLALLLFIVYQRIDKKILKTQKT